MPDRCGAIKGPVIFRQRVDVTTIDPSPAMTPMHDDPLLDRRRHHLGFAVRTDPRRLCVPDHQGSDYDRVQELRFCGGTKFWPDVLGSRGAPVYGRTVGGMTEPLFFPRPKGLTAQEIAALTGAVPCGRARARPARRGIATLDRAGPCDLAFCRTRNIAGPLRRDPRRHLPRRPRASPTRAPADVAVLVTPRALSGFRRGRAALYPGALRPSRCSTRAASRRARSCIRRRGSRAASRSIPPRSSARARKSAPAP